jgi:hypothetical protein
MSKLKLVDTNKYVRDTHSKGLISSDIKALQAYKMSRDRMNKIEEFGTDINNLRKELTDIKILLENISNSLYKTNRV